MKWQKTKDNLIAKMPDSLFAALVNHKGRAKIVRRVHWVVYKDGIRLATPTPKFIGFGSSTFRDKFEQHFRIEKGWTAMDVGACIGDTTVPIAQKVGPEGRVIAVEPDPTNARYLRANTAAYPNVEIVQKAVWDRPCRIVLNVGKDPSAHSIVLEADEKIDVEADTLDGIRQGRQIDYCKIDVQGVEREAVAGIAGTGIKRLVVQTHGWQTGKATCPDVVRALESRGYRTTTTATGVIHAWLP